MTVLKERVCDDRSYIGELAHCIGFDSDVVLLELLFDLIDASGDVLGLRADKREDKQQTPDQIRVDWRESEYATKHQEEAGKIQVCLLFLFKTTACRRGG